jgi:hypothetical protein
MKYKEKSEQLEKELQDRSQEISFLRTQLNAFEEQFNAAIGGQLDSEEAREVLRRFASKAESREELVLLVRALSKIPA